MSVGDGFAFLLKDAKYCVFFSFFFSISVIPRLEKNRMKTIFFKAKNYFSGSFCLVRSEVVKRVIKQS